MERPPKETKGEIALKIAEAGISAIPVIGGPLAVLSEFLGEPYARRRQSWLEDLAEVVTELRDRVEDLSKPLDENEQFLTAVLHANQIAMRTHQEEKLRALRNAVRNSALKSAPAEDQQLMFLKFVDDLTVSHIRVLRIFDDPHGAIEKTRKETGREVRGVGPLSLVIFYCIPELQKGRLYEQLCRDLENRGLVERDTLTVTMSIPSQVVPRATDFGKEFLRFIS